MPNLWFYVKPGSAEKMGPVTEEEFRRLISSGEIPAASLVWKEGLPDWAPLHTLPEGQNAVLPPPDAGPALTPPSGMSGWLTFLGVANIVFGVLSVLSCFGIINGIFLLVCGTALLGARTALRSEQPDWPTFLSKLNTYFVMYGVMLVFSLIGFVVLMALFFHQILQTVGSTMH